MDHSDQKYKSKLLYEKTLFSQIKNMSYEEFREISMGQEYLTIHDLIMAFLTIVFLNRKDIEPFKEILRDADMLKKESSLKYSLTEDDIKTIKLIAEGLSNARIAERLGTISTDGVAKRVNSIFRKLGVNNRTEASVKAVRLGLL